LLKKPDSKIALPPYLWVKGKANWQKKPLNWPWLKENGYCCKTATWLHLLCRNLKEFWKMLLKFTEISEFG
jgi:hypothetical protein